MPTFIEDVANDEFNDDDRVPAKSLPQPARQKEVPTPRATGPSAPRAPAREPHANTPPPRVHLW